MQSTLFLNAITCVDHAYICPNGRVVGGSYHPNFEVTGQVEETESVVVDFSSVKKQLKSAIDHRDNGYDHKLWIIKGFSDCKYQIKDGVVYINTPACRLSMPQDAVRIFDTDYKALDCFAECVEEEFNKYLTACLQKLHPELNISVKTSLTNDPHTQTIDYHMFRYSHGLKSSTSWGCQNHSHGHLSFIEFHTKHPKTISPLIYKTIAELDKAIFIYRDNIVTEDDLELSIAYTSPRGTFRATYVKSENKIIVLDTETTIEHIVDWYVNKNRTLLEAQDITRVFVSEGLSKGAVVTL